MGFIPTLEILSALKDRLTVLELEPGKAAFARVDYYGQPHLPQALQDLRLFQDRICLIVPDGETYRNEVAGRTQITRCNRHVILLLADRDCGRPSQALAGGEAAAGVVRLNELVAAGLAGQFLRPEGARVRPEFSQPVLLTTKERELAPGRAAWHLELTVEAGWMKV